MAITNYERVGKAMDLLKAGLAPFIEREMTSQYQQDWLKEAKEALSPQQLTLAASLNDPLSDVSAMLALMSNRWQDLFRKTLGQAERALVGEIRTIRNNWAHQGTFSTDDAYRALDSVHRLLLAVSAAQANDLEQMKMELLRVRFDEQVRSEKRKSSGTTIESTATGGLKPWREIVTPHKDVASGRYQQAEFAADLWQVHLGTISARRRRRLPRIRGIEDRRVKLGCMMPGESPAVFGDALRRLAAVATYLYQGMARVTGTRRSLPLPSSPRIAPSN